MADLRGSDRMQQGISCRPVLVSKWALEAGINAGEDDFSVFSADGGSFVILHSSRRSVVSLGSQIRSYGLDGSIGNHGGVSVRRNGDMEVGALNFVLAQPGEDALKICPIVLTVHGNHL